MYYRLLTLIIKELHSLWREPQTRAVLILPVLIQMLIFPFAATLEVRNATIAIHNEDSGKYSVELIQRIVSATAFTKVRVVQRHQDAVTVLENQQALLVVRFPADFSRHLANRKPSNLQIILDGRNSNSAQVAANYLQQIVGQYQLELLGQSTAKDNSMAYRNWYNPNLDYKWPIIPSLIAMVTTIGVMGILVISMAREREQGTMEQLLVSPLASWQIILGKAVPALIVALCQASVVFGVGILLYGIPFNGSPTLFYFTMLVYGMSLIGIALLIAALCTTQQQGFIGGFCFIMPAILLSGYLAPVENMPVWLQNLTWVNPIRHFTSIAKEIYLKDASLNLVWRSLWPLMVIAAASGSAAYVLFRRKVG